MDQFSHKDQLILISQFKDKPANPQQYFSQTDIKKRSFKQIEFNEDIVLRKKEKNKRRKLRQKQNKQQNIKYAQLPQTDSTLNQSNQQLNKITDNEICNSKNAVTNNNFIKQNQSQQVFAYNDIIYCNQAIQKCLNYDQKNQILNIGRYKQQLIKFGYQDQEILVIQSVFKNYPYFKFFFDEARSQFKTDCSKKLCVQNFIIIKPSTLFKDVQNPIIMNTMNEYLEQYFCFQKQQLEEKKFKLQFFSQNQAINSIKISNNDGDQQLLKVFHNIQYLFSSYNSDQYDHKKLALQLKEEFENMLQCQFFIQLYKDDQNYKNLITHTSKTKRNYFMQFTNNQYQFPKDSGLQQLKEDLVFHKNQKEQNYVIQSKQYGIKRYTNSQVQYQGNFKNQEIWNEIISDINNVNPDYGYDLIIADPPWDETAIPFKYQTSPDRHWMNQIPLNKLQKQGLYGSWVTNAKLESCLDFLQKNDYERIDMIPWLKMKEDGTAEVSIGYYLLHGFELFILAKKKNCQNRIKQICNRQSALGIIVAERRETSRKPDEIYYIMDTFLKKNTYKLELFGRQYNQRDGWSTAGNESIFLKNDFKNSKFYPEKLKIIMEEEVIKDTAKQLSFYETIGL